MRVPDGPPRLVHVGGCEYHNHLEQILGQGAALIHPGEKIMVLEDVINIIEGGFELCRMDCAVIKGPAVLASDGEDCTITLYGGGGDFTDAQVRFQPCFVFVLKLQWNHPPHELIRGAYMGERVRAEQSSSVT